MTQTSTDPKNQDSQAITHGAQSLIELLEQQGESMLVYIEHERTWHDPEEGTTKAPRYMVIAVSDQVGINQVMSAVVQGLGV
ncbi:MAG: hypothetical protein ACPGVO_04450 [Spirulinaceae cyanobacterium]